MVITNLIIWPQGGGIRKVIEPREMEGNKMRTEQSESSWREKRIVGKIKAT